MKHKNKIKIKEVSRMKFNPYYLVAFLLIGMVGGLVYYRLISNKLGGGILILFGILFYIFKIGEKKK